MLAVKFSHLLQSWIIFLIYMIHNRMQIRISRFNIGRMKCLKALLIHLFNAHLISAAKLMKIHYILCFHLDLFQFKNPLSSFWIIFMKTTFLILFIRKMKMMIFKIFRLWLFHKKIKLKLILRIRLKIQN